MMYLNPVTAIDGYKVDHRRQYPDNTQVIFSNLTARKSRRGYTEQMVFFGLQYFIKHYLIDSWNRDFFQQPKEQVIRQFSRRINNYLGPNNVGTQHIEALHDLGYLPIKIMALPEGSVYPLKVPCLVLYNTDERFFWLTNYLETILSANVWGMCTSATTALQYRKIFETYALETDGNIGFVDWQGHDFSFRGMYGVEAAVMSGAAHLLSFTGTDTIPAIDFLEQYYLADSDKELVGGSVAATEHSVMCAGGMENELETFRRLIEDIYPSGIVSIVSDSWDFWQVMTEFTVALKDRILTREGKVVFRPDTGCPVKIICGDPQAAVGSPEYKGAIECLWDVFGGSTTAKGYKLLDSHVGLIYGDSITIERAEAICAGLKAKGFASTNIVFGIGSFTYQHVTRDTDGYAVKATFAKVDGKDREIFKDPKTDDGTKKSAKGLVAVFKDAQGQFYLKDQASWQDVNHCEFVPVFADGELLTEYSLADIRARLAASRC
ncbi:MAG: nicotinate phosphoribosyltransferase [Shewanella xiamenensis]|uniref:nicotinate phosphoribosyltransferase n=2 Tax=Shewanellaceae TaxID=267890 RepID=UPI001D0296B9|nr:MULTISPECIES: nicotinate phosphoribosyltransferase [Shewanella]MCD8561179.1 nicotinate phosphoribosyltransferase [Shewanella xiamenensis]MDH1627293.1 nicotinate phosphoribosyltransferase [Shewanella xiamenensis]MDN5526788.1 nicotinate phosphoribosyltransferase [Shewanella sp.]MDV5248930.1 nicotinate phosphoribosyltransferase [Shewanella xiamenensis]UWG66338.1 nicotinate phosphoribosyltransferase [Shewanella xiamenensis]